VHARLGRLRVLRALQRPGPAHEGVGEVDGDVGHALDRRRVRARLRDVGLRAVVEPGGDGARIGTTDARTSATDSAVNPSSFSIEPSTRQTFQPGRVSANGFTTPWNSCSRPSQLMKLPAVSVNGEIGRITSAKALAWS
jgi:hypothetical protein